MANWAMWVGAVILGISLAGLFPIGLMLPLDEAKEIVAREQVHGAQWC